MELLEDKTGFYYYFIRWLPKDRSTELKKVYQEILCEMVASDNLHIKYDGMSLCEQYRVKAVLPLLEKERHNDRTPEFIHDIYEENGGVGYAWTISQRARTVIGTLSLSGE